ncbi:UNVERIFIED_CONTAM: hypothetical protein Slati_4611000, partial [Sesamum latifolium]
ALVHREVGIEAEEWVRLAGLLQCFRVEVGLLRLDSGRQGPARSFSGRSIPSCANCGRRHTEDLKLQGRAVWEKTHNELVRAKGEDLLVHLSHDFASRVHASIEPLGHDLCVSMPVDLVVINLREFDVILRMDWLASNHVLVACQTKEVAVEVNGQMKTVIVGERKVIPNCLISAVTAFNLIKEWCEAYLASAHDTTKVSPDVLEVPVVREFPDIFSEELPGLPPHQEVDFEIETIPGATPISIAPYRMASSELKVKEAVRRVAG